MILLNWLRKVVFKDFGLLIFIGNPISFRPLGRILRIPTWRNAKFIFKMTFQATKNRRISAAIFSGFRGAGNRTRAARPPASRTAIILHPAFARCSGLRRASPSRPRRRVSISFFYFFGLAIVLMHLAQAFILLPESESTHWRLGYFLFFSAGLYLPRSLFRGVIKVELLPHRRQFLFIFAIVICF